MVNTAQSQLDYVQDQVPDQKIASHFSCRYVYNSSVQHTTFDNEFSVQKNTWKKWYHDSKCFKPVVPSVTFADVVKNKVLVSQQHKHRPLVAVQGRSQQRKPPELVKEVSGTPQMTHLKMAGQNRLVKKVMSDDASYDSVPCFNKFAPLSQVKDEDYDTLDNTLLYESSLDTSTFAALGTGGEHHRGPSTAIDKNDKFDALLVKKKIDPCLISQAITCSDYKACKSQMGEPFGVIPLSPLLVYTGPETNNKPMPDPLSLHRHVRQSGCPNFLGSRIPVDSKLNIKNWRFHLQNFWDKQLVDLLEYGFPLDFNRNARLVSTEENHSSATKFASDVRTYISEELQHEAMLGPFISKPINLHVSPFMTREKPDSNVRRTIVDLSWPDSCSVNDGVLRDEYLGSKFLLYYPSVDDIVNKLNELGPGSLMFKIDISRAFRQLKVDPGDIDLLGLKQEGYFIDQSVPFGYRHGSIFFEKVTDSIRYIMRKHGFNNLFNYVDDLIYCDLPSKIHQAYEFLLKLLPKLGLDINNKKLVPPTTSMICLGILVDSQARTMSVPPEKLASIVTMCQQWKNKKSCTKRQLQSLLGSLLFISKCVRPARIFLNRMLAFLRCMGVQKIATLTSEFFRDLNWFCTFLKQFNGVVFYDPRPIQAELHLDACLTGMGGVFENQCYALPIPRDFRQYSIVHLEMLNIVVALKVWATQWSNKKLRIKCDNMAVVEVLTSGKTKDNILATCARNVWLLSAIFNISIHIEHIPGKQNVIADLLSRYQFDTKSWDLLNTYVPNVLWIPTHIDLTCLNFSI